jgi:hypothetical protein
MAAEFKMAAKLILFSQSLKSNFFNFLKIMYALTNYHIFMELFFFSKIQNGEFIQDGGNLGKIFQGL